MVCSSSDKITEKIDAILVAMQYEKSVAISEIVSGVLINFTWIIRKMLISNFARQPALFLSKTVKTLHKRFVLWLLSFVFNGCCTFHLYLHFTILF